MTFRTNLPCLVPRGGVVERREPKNARRLTLRARLTSAHRIAQRRELLGGVRTATKPGQAAGGTGNVGPARQRRHLVARMDAGEVLRTPPGHAPRPHGASRAGGRRERLGGG